MRPGARTAGNRSPTERTIDQSNVDLDGWISPGIEDLAALDVFDQAHGLCLSERKLQCRYVMAEFCPIFANFASLPETPQA
jgi:hypothetical protein